MTAGFHPLKILDVRRETEDAISVRLAPSPDAAERFCFTPGQHLTLRAEVGGEELRRNYSICAAPGETLRIGIKRIEGGAFSSWALDGLTAGGEIEAMPPHGSFTWRFSPETSARYLGVAGGSGITPILSLTRTGLATEPESQFTLLYGNRTSDSIMFLEEIAGLKDRYLSRLQVYHFLEHEMDEVELFNGRLDAERISQVLQSLVDPATLDAAFICGPGPMMSTAETALKAAGLAADRVLVERFTVGRPSQSQLHADRILEERAAGLQMQVTLDGRRRQITFDPERKNILESARAAGMPAPFACKAGVCATCRAKVVSGEVQMKANYGLSAEELADGYILTCQAVPLTADVVIDYDA
jgi:ring-1,2-phenylacetyl-CoA epoxidase subunit PaaE